jgi:vacuolar-type H+-ATPase subunit F/Vma7
MPEYVIAAFADEPIASLFRLFGAEVFAIDSPAQLDDALARAFGQRQFHLCIVLERFVQEDPSCVEKYQREYKTRLLILPDHSAQHNVARTLLKQALIRATGTEMVAEGM